MSHGRQNDLFHLHTHGMSIRKMKQKINKSIIHLEVEVKTIPKPAE